jgi:hypothetical protein
MLPRGEKKTEKTGKQIIEKTELWKKPIKPIKILKKRAGLVQFRFISLKPKKPNRNWKNPSQTGKTEPNRFEQVFSLKNRTELNQNRSVWTSFGSVLVFFEKKNSIWLFFFYKNRTEPKMSTPNAAISI